MGADPSSPDRAFGAAPVSAEAESRTVSVIIAAYNAEATLARAIRSALAQPEAAEVIVVDDASPDTTLEIARDEAARDARVKPLSLARNSGPGAARNLGLDSATSDFVAVLDADDVFLPGRLARLLACQDAEMIADNILFATQGALGSLPDISDEEPRFETIDAAAFVRGNLPRRGIARGELGFLKPLMSRDFLERYGLRYDPDLRLGEDFDLYLRMLRAGAKLRMTRVPGYAALVRAESLSAQHGTTELSHFHDCLAGHVAERSGDPSLDRAMRTHLATVRGNRDHRAFLDTRREDGNLAALRYAMAAPMRPFSIGWRILRDKLGLSVRAGDAVPDGAARLLLPMERDLSAPGGKL
ncbi:glycosyltransferase family 2 protein [Aestuariibius sp. 2305UL40-4]|uniref:glycosyltransferase family 2 protein n=1 Tax=Aestuariibius violaceus TaxID=3234132 RepID=UPI00345F0EA8